MDSSMLRTKSKVLTVTLKFSHDLFTFCYLLIFSLGTLSFSLHTSYISFFEYHEHTKPTLTSERLCRCLCLCYLFSQELSWLSLTSVQSPPRCYLCSKLYTTILRKRPTPVFPYTFHCITTTWSYNLYNLFLYHLLTDCEFHISKQHHLFSEKSLRAW